MLWDVFCRVIDNFGDIGVCWRLAADLAGRGQAVRLWVDDASTLSWMAPHLHWTRDDELGLVCGQGHDGIKVCHWDDAVHLDARCPGLRAGDVVIEAFGCDPPDAFVARMQARAAEGQASQWVNLEYLSAEDYVERSHGLASPVFSGVGAGLRKRFFYPGFTPATGGLLREAGLLAARTAELGTPQQRLDYMRALGIPVQEGDTTLLVFCYESAPFADLANSLSRLQATQPATHVLLTAGPAARLGSLWAQAHPTSRLKLHTLPYLAQDAFDRLLWCCDLNLVRGEDSAVRALWAGRPHIWQIYEQDDGVHAGKLEAFMARWMRAWPGELRCGVEAWWRAWNGLGPMPDALTSPLPDWQTASSAWRAWSEKSRAELLDQTDLASQLITFVSSSG